MDTETPLEQKAKRDRCMEATKKGPADAAEIEVECRGGCVEEAAIGWWRLRGGGSDPLVAAAWRMWDEGDAWEVAEP